MEPKEEYRYNNDTLIEYVDKFYNSIEDIEFYITQIVSKYFVSDQQYCKTYFAALKKSLLNIGYDFNKLSLFYKNCFSDMSENFVDKVGANCVGYTTFHMPLSESNTVNELLHLIHQSIVNNEYILQSIPKLGIKDNEFGYPITLYGVEQNISKQIFDKFPTNIDCGWTDIVSLKDKTIMMVRDRGHALSIEIEKENDKYYIKYFIPKICNVDMVNNLKGVNKVNDESKYTVGIIESNESNLAFELFDFISKVPTDSDMDFSKYNL